MYDEIGTCPKYTQQITCIYIRSPIFRTFRAKEKLVRESGNIEKSGAKLQRSTIQAKRKLVGEYEKSWVTRYHVSEKSVFYCTSDNWKKLSLTVYRHIRKAIRKWMWINAIVTEAVLMVLNSRLQSIWMWSARYTTRVCRLLLGRRKTQLKIKEKFVGFVLKAELNKDRWIKHFKCVNATKLACLPSSTVDVFCWWTVLTQC